MLPLAQAESQRQAARPGLAVDGAFSPARACWPASSPAQLECSASQSARISAPHLMNSMLHFPVQTVLGLALALCAHGAQAQAVWKLEARAATGPIAQVALADSGTKRRSAFIAFEYARKCDPIFSFVEITGSRLGTAVRQSVLSGSKIGVLVNGRFHTWNAATTRYENGYEAGFGITSELFDVLTGTVDSLVYVTPDGERVPMPTDGFRQAVELAFDTCAKRFR